MTLVYATSRSWSGQGDPPHVPLTRVLIVAVALLNYTWLWSQAVALTNQITHAILGVPAVTNGIETMFEVLIAGAALGGLPLIGLLLMGVGGLQLIALIFVKVVLILVGALAFAIGPLMIGLVATERGNALARAWMTMTLGLFVLPIVWASIFAIAAVLINDASSGSAVLGSGAGLGRLLGGLLIALAAIAGFWLAIKLTKAFGSLVVRPARRPARARRRRRPRTARRRRPRRLKRRRRGASSAAGAAGSLRGLRIEGRRRRLGRRRRARPCRPRRRGPCGRRRRRGHARSRRPDRRRRRAGIQGHRRRRAQQRRSGRGELAARAPSRRGPRAAHAAAGTPRHVPAAPSPRAAPERARRRPQAPPPTRFRSASATQRVARRRAGRGGSRARSSDPQPGRTRGEASRRPSSPTPTRTARRHACALERAVGRARRRRERPRRTMRHANAFGQPRASEADAVGAPALQAGTDGHDADAAPS